MTVAKVAEPFCERTLSFVKSWAIKKENLLKVLGTLSIGLISINTPSSVLI